MDTLFEEKWNGIHFPNCASVKLLEDKGEGLLREPLETVSTNCIWHLAHLKPVDIVPRQEARWPGRPEWPRRPTPPDRSAASGSVGRGQDDIDPRFWMHLWLWVQVSRFRAQGRTTFAALSIAHPEKWEIIGFLGPHVLIQHAIFMRHMVGLQELQ